MLLCVAYTNSSRFLFLNESIFSAMYNPCSSFAGFSLKSLNSDVLEEWQFLSHTSETRKGTMLNTTENAMQQYIDNTLAFTIPCKPTCLLIK